MEWGHSGCLNHRRARERHSTSQARPSIGLGCAGRIAGIARVFLDGTLRATVDLYEPFALQAVVFSASGLANTSHALRIEVTGLHNSASTDSIVAVDAFDTRARFEETHSSIAYTETWEVTVSRAWSDKTSLFTWVTNAHAIFSFTSTSVRWIGYRGPLGGIARVYLDGTFVRDIDTYSADETHQAILYEAQRSRTREPRVDDREYRADEPLVQRSVCRCGRVRHQLLRRTHLPPNHRDQSRSRHYGSFSRRSRVLVISNPLRNGLHAF